MKVYKCSSWSFNRYLLVLLLSLFVYVSSADAQTRSSKKDSTSIPATVPPPLLQKGQSGERYFGDLAITYSLDSAGTSILCSLYLVTQFVYIHTLNATNPDCDFEVQLGTAKSSGQLRLNLSPADSGAVSTLSGNFNYTASANHTDYIFKGDLTGWFIIDNVKKR